MSTCQSVISTIVIVKVQLPFTCSLLLAVPDVGMETFVTPHCRPFAAILEALVEKLVFNNESAVWAVHTLTGNSAWPVATTCHVSKTKPFLLLEPGFEPGSITDCRHHFQCPHQALGPRLPPSNPPPPGI